MQIEFMVQPVFPSESAFDSWYHEMRKTMVANDGAYTVDSDYVDDMGDADDPQHVYRVWLHCDHTVSERAANFLRPMFGTSNLFNVFVYVRNMHAPSELITAMHTISKPLCDGVELLVQCGDDIDGLEMVCSKQHQFDAVLAAITLGAK